MAKTYLVKQTLAGWYLIRNAHDLFTKDYIDSFPMFIDPEYGALLDSDGDTPFFTNSGWEFMQFTPAPPGCYGYFACCDDCGRHEIVAVESPGVLIDIVTHVLITRITNGMDECENCKHGNETANKADSEPGDDE